jgi:hypothetical protein
MASQETKSIVGRVSVNRFLAIYRALATTLFGAGLAVFVGYRRWGIAASTAGGGVVCLLVLATVVAGFIVSMIVVGAVAWLDL